MHFSNPQKRFEVEKITSVQLNGTAWMSTGKLQRNGPMPRECMVT